MVPVREVQRSANLLEQYHITTTQPKKKKKKDDSAKKKISHNGCLTHIAVIFCARHQKMNGSKRPKKQPPRLHTTSQHMYTMYNRTELIIKDK